MQAWDKFLEIKHAQSEDVQELLNKLIEDVQSINKELAEFINTPSCSMMLNEQSGQRSTIGKNSYLLCDDDATPLQSTRYYNREPDDNSLSMGDEHLDTIPATESDEVIKSSVEDLVPIPSESEGIPDAMIVVNSDDDNSSSDDDSPYGENIDYVDASPPDVEIVSLEVVEIVDPEVGRIDDDILLTIKDDILREKLLNVNLLIAKIDALRDNPTPSSDVMTKSSSTSLNLFLEETNTFDNSLPEAVKLSALIWRDCSAVPHLSDSISSKL
ncbi:hypothetical protein Tco_0180674 [Tanacetum coccineum]